MNNYEIEQTIKTLQNEIEERDINLHEMGKAGITNSSIAQQQNLIEWQLDLSKELELIGHNLRGHVIERDKDGNEFWAEPTMVNEKGEKVIDPERKLFNEKGAQEIEKIIRNYLNRQILLSNFDIPIIKQRCMQLANRLRAFIYLHYEDFGLDTDYKMKHFSMIVMNIVDIVEAGYYRALNGGERESLRTARSVTQSEGFGKQNGISNIMGGEPKSKLNPLNWFGR